MVVDNISNLIITLKNAQAAKHDSVSVADTKMNRAVLDVLKKEGFVADIEKAGKDLKKRLVVTLKYEDGAPAISEVQRVSKQSKRMYAGYKEIKPVRSGYGITVFSTPQGILSDKGARKAKVGGEILFKMW
jgi:small subunit ribosomal protein S8